MNAVGSPSSGDEPRVRVVGRYAIHGELASGGMAAVHLGRLIGEVGFARTVAIKRLHTQYARDPEFVAMFLDEARLVSRIKHPNVVPTLDIVSLDGELFLVMEYVHGEPLSRVMMALGKKKTRMPINVAVGICLGLLEGLHAAHEAKAEDGTQMGIVHRDVSPQNVMVGADGVARVLDFGIAKAAKRIQTTEEGQFKGKIGYMPPDVLSGSRADRRADIWGATVVLWEMLVGRRLFISDESPFSLVKMIVEKEVDPPSRRGVASPPELDAVIKRGLMKAPEDRFATAREMAVALEAAVSPASPRAIAEWLYGIAKDALDERALRVEEVEKASHPELLSVGKVQGLANAASSKSGPLPPLPPHAHSDPIAPAWSPISSSRETVVMAQTILAPPKPGGWSKPGVLVTVAMVVFALVVIVPVTILTVRRATRPVVVGSQQTSSMSTSDQPPPAPSPPPPAVTTETAAASAAPPSTTVAAAGAAAPHSTTPVKKPAATAHEPPKSCNPPYTIGPPPDYIRKPKLECLPR